MPNNSIVKSTINWCIFYQKESARRYAVAQWEMANGALSRATMQQETAANEASEARIRLSQLVGGA